MLLCHVITRFVFLSFFFFNDTATTEIYTLSLHDALPIWITPVRRSTVVRSGAGSPSWSASASPSRSAATHGSCHRRWKPDRKSTRLNSSHGYISYAVFCLKKKKNSPIPRTYITQPHDNEC